MTDPKKTSNDAENAASKRSQVTPNPRLKKIKEKGLFAALVVGCAIFAIVSFMPEHPKVREEGESSSEEIVNNTLAQNLKHLAEMKEQTAAFQDKIAALPRPGNHPPVLRSKTSSPPKLSQEILARMNAPTTFSIDADIESSSGNEAGSGNNAQSATLTNNNANAQFINQQDDIVSVSAKRLPHPELTIPAGELIPATLETAMNSELPGMVRAITTRDVYSLQGGNLLLPKGATLVGQFNANVVQGQRRLLVVWNRVQMSNGVVVTLNSPGTDTLGRSGQGADYIDRHFMERFGTGALLSVLGAYAATGGVNGQDQYNSKAQYRMALSGNLQQAAGDTLEQDMQVKPTLQINQGTRINVFVAHDLDFNSVGAVKNAIATPVRRGLWKR